jgi:hypothetical protein
MKNQTDSLSKNEINLKEVKKSEYNNSGYMILSRLEANDTIKGIAYYAVSSFQ